MTFVIGRGKYARAVYPVARHSAPVPPDERVKATAADTTPNFLSPKLAAGAGITLAVLNPGGNEQVEITATAVSEDHKVSVTAADTTPGFLADKIPTTSDVLVTVGNPGADEDLLLSVVGITEASGPTSLPIGAIPPGSVLARSGGAIVGVAPVFTPTAHAPTHAPATGTDPLATAAPSQGIGGGNSAGVADSFARSDHDHTIRETGGPTDLTVGVIADEQFVKRTGGALVGARISAGILFWGNSSVAATTATRYLEPGYETATAPLVAAIVQIRAPFAGTLRNLFIRQNGTAGNGNLIVYTVRVNGVATLLSVSIASTTANGSDIVNTVVVAQGDLIDIEVTKAIAVGTSPARIAASLEMAA